MSSAKRRPEKAELERRVKRCRQLPQRKRWPPGGVRPSLVTASDWQRGHGIEASSCTSAYPPHVAAREPLIIEDVLPEDGPDARAHILDLIMLTIRVDANGRPASSRRCSTRPAFVSAP